MKSFLTTQLRRIAAGSLMLASAVTATALPASAATVDDIVKKGSITVGMLVDFPPYGINNAQNQPDGYDADVAKLMGKHMGVKVDLVPLSGPNRIPFLLTNKVDVLVASFGITEERAKQVQFSDPYASIDVVLLAPKDAAISSADDLKGLRIAVTRASTQDLAVTSTAPKGTKIMRFDDDATATQALLSRQVDGLGVSTIVAREINKLDPSAGYEPKFTLRRQFQGIAIQKNQPELTAWINKFLTEVKTNGELNAIHQKWLGTDLPNLDMPKS
jgi:polar amino acid transport system substrate-binding protein